MSTSANTVVVACKLPAGIIMQGYRMEDIQEPVLGGGTRAAKRAVPEGPKIKINGNAAPQGSTNLHVVRGGYALTHGVPAETAKAWMAANKDSPMVRNRLIYFTGNAAQAEGRSREMETNLSGLERLNVGTIRKEGREIPADPRWPRSNNANVSAIKSDSR